MTQITATLVRDLRNQTGAGMMDCKKALNETNGSIEDAVDWLRKKGLASAQKKTGRVAREGLVALHLSPLRGDIIEVNAETDFVARNELFQDYVHQVAALAANCDGNIENVSQQIMPSTKKTAGDTLNDLVAKIGENMTLRRSAFLSVDEGVVTGYIHNQKTPTSGQIGVLVALRSAGDKAALQKLAKNIAMHVAAARPQFLNTDDVDEKTLERERQILIEQAKNSGKPENIIEKMVEGRLRKFYEEVVLNNQIFVIDGERKISKLIADEAKNINAEIKITGFIRFELGDGIEKREQNFAEEVQAVVQA
ncbi:MAG: translation elongation factor Ts [Pseudomonadota bacterium]